MSRHRNITRMDYAGKARSWWVRIYRGYGVDKQCINKTFSDAKLGGKRRALEAALRWRDKTLRKLAPPGSRQVAIGHGYVQRATLEGPGGVKYDVHRAYVKVGPDKWRSATRSMAKHGARKSKWLCEGWLEAQQIALRSSDVTLGRRKAA